MESRAALAIYLHLSGRNLRARTAETKDQDGSCWRHPYPAWPVLTPFRTSSCNSIGCLCSAHLAHLVVVQLGTLLLRFCPPMVATALVSAVLAGTTRVNVCAGSLLVVITGLAAAAATMAAPVPRPPWLGLQWPLGTKPKFSRQPDPTGTVAADTDIADLLVLVVVDVTAACADMTDSRTAHHGSAAFGGTDCPCVGGARSGSASGMRACGGSLGALRVVPREDVEEAAVAFRAEQ